MRVDNTEDISHVLCEANEGTGGDFSYYLAGEEDFLWPEDMQLFPDTWSWEIVEINKKIDHDSYGYGYARDAYVIIKVSDWSNEQLYLIPGSYASYDGWNWDLTQVTKTKKTEKTVLVWSSVDD